MNEKQIQLKKAMGTVRCPLCGRGDITASHEQDREHKIGCEVKRYIAQIELWKQYE